MHGHSGKIHLSHHFRLLGGQQLYTSLLLEPKVLYKQKSHIIIFHKILLLLLAKRFSQSQVQVCQCWHTSLRRMQCTITMTNPSRESKIAKRIWKRAERRSVMANTADIQVSANSGRTTHELHRDALQERKGYTDSSKLQKRQRLQTSTTAFTVGQL